MSIPAAAFVRNRPGLPHMLDERRPVGRYQTGGREDGTGYGGTTTQYPVICAEDIVEAHASEATARPSTYVTTDPRAVRCKDCRERMGLRV